MDGSGNLTISGDSTFTTPSVTPASNPILVVVDSTSANPFGAYMGEVLRAEGINAFQVEAPATVTSAYLAGFPIVVLTQTQPLTAAQAAAYSAYVQGGGSLLALRPDPQLASVFGMSVAAGTTQEGYLLVNAANPLGAGISNQTMQFHGVADHYTLNGGTALATLYSDATTATAFPAVVANTFGSGRAAAFTFDLVRSGVYTRQGNPATAGSADADGVVRTLTGFTNGWLNVDRASVPQADEQQRLLANIVESFGQQTTPIPRAWYFPSANTRSVLIVTGDDHGRQDSVFQNYASIVEQYGGDMSFYLARFGALTPSTLRALQSRGHELTIHPYGQADNQTLDQGFAAAINWFESTYGLVPSPTVRNHQVAWQGWADGARVEAKYGIGMDTSFYHWGSWLVQSNGQPSCTGWPTGSGLPMKFVDETGALVNVYQQVTQLVDEQLLTDAGAGFCGMDQAQATTASKQLVDSALGGFYSAVTMQVHTDYGATTWLGNMAAYAQSRGMPIWTTQRWLNFTQARHDATVDQLTWNATSHLLSFRYTSATTESSSAVLLPGTWQTKSITATTVDGTSAAATSITVKGLTYAAVPVPNGTHTLTVQYAP